VTDIHDDRSIPMEPEALTPRESKFFRLMAFLGLREKNQHDERVLKAAEANRPIREADARRTLAQPGASAEAVAKAERVFARIGSGAKK
jgi:hypothetical protein